MFVLITIMLFWWDILGRKLRYRGDSRSPTSELFTTLYRKMGRRRFFSIFPSDCSKRYKNSMMINSILQYKSTSNMVHHLKSDILRVSSALKLRDCWCILLKLLCIWRTNMERGFLCLLNVNFSVLLIARMLRKLIGMTIRGGNILSIILRNL